MREFRDKIMQSKNIFQIVLLVLAIGLSYLVLNNLSFLISPALWGIIFFLTFRPLYNKLINKEKWNKYLASGFLVFILIMILLIILSLTYLVINAKLIPIFQNPELLRASFDTLINNLNDLFHNSILNSFGSNFTNTILNFIPKVANYLIPFLRNLGIIIMDIGISLIIFYILLINDNKIRDFLIKISPFKDGQSESFLDRFENLVRGSAVVIPMVAISQGLLGFLGY